MKLSSTGQLALSALLRNRMRSVLTTLGIVIGVAAVLMMQSLGQGATAYVAEAISGLGTNVLMVVPGGTSRGMGGMTLGVPLFTQADVDALRLSARDVGHLAPVNTRPMRVVASAINRSTSVSGVAPEYFEIREWGVQAGRLLSKEDERDAAQVCLVGQTNADALFPGEQALGRELRVRQMSCRIIGVLEAKGASAFGTDQDDVVMMPYSTFSRRIIGTDRVAMFMVSAVASDRIDAAKEQIVATLRRRRHLPEGEDDDFGVRDPREMQALLTKVTGVLTTLLAGVAAISLLVGGIGIMNIMLVSVTERTREIGVRLAVGARARDILTQFLVEAIALSAVGGVGGVALGLLGAVGLTKGVNVPFVMPTFAIPVAFGVSVAVGVLFGVVPARKAARLNPLAALRFE
ncbi:MAG: ABC transporter permease [Archangiaceae bacterium]|nr:ABC transporter permease [Archangiaceae bacterium]